MRSSMCPGTGALHRSSGAKCRRPGARHPSRRVLLRRLLALAVPSPASPRDGGGHRTSRTVAGWCSASATAFRSCRRPASCRARYCGTRPASFAASGFICESSRATRRSRSTAAQGRSCGSPSRTARATFSADPETLDELERKGQVVFRYCSADGQVTAESNPNGSLRNIAGISNAGGNVVGLMPHPERACEALLGGDDGLVLFRSAIRALSRVAA